MWFLLFACAGEPDCGVGYVAVDGECVPRGDDGDDTGGPPDDTGDPSDPGTLACDGLHVVADQPVLRELCGECDGFVCTWTVLAAGPLDGAEIDLHDAEPFDEDEPWTEFHDAFVVVESAAGREVRELVLAPVDDPRDYGSNQSTWIDPTDPVTADALTLSVSADDAEGVYQDCFVWGHDPSVFSGDCPVVAR